MTRTAYTGEVCYADGWHLTVDEAGNPGERLFLEDDGSYRLAEDGDASWHERKHQAFATVQMGDGSSIRVSATEADAVRGLLADLRGG